MEDRLSYQQNVIIYFAIIVYFTVINSCVKSSWLYAVLLI